MTTQHQMAAFAFDNSYAALSNSLFSRQNPTPVSAPGLIAFNTALAQQLGLNSHDLQSETGLQILAGNSIPAGAEPIATAYAGHQFGNWVPQLGDGRAVLLGEIKDKQGERFDIQLKGAGPTPYSRNGDGRAAVGPVVREYVVSEAMAALGIPTTRALAAISTGDKVRRETMLPGAVLTRVAQSHIRVGTFQFFAARRDLPTLKLLTQHVIDRHYPHLNESANLPLALLQAVLAKQARLIALWQSVGFIHGVMNTDNASVAGLTIDYGPCAFMDTYKPDTVFSSIDHASRYAYQNQPGIAQWNIANLAQCLLPLIDSDEDKSLQAAQELIDSFPSMYESEYLTLFARKIGINTPQPGDAKLIADLLQCMHDGRLDFTNTFRALSHCNAGQLRDTHEKVSAGVDSRASASIGVDAGTSTGVSIDRNLDVNTAFLHQCSDAEGITSWFDAWQHRLATESKKALPPDRLMRASNPAYIPRNHQIEKIITAALEENYSPIQELSKVLSTPFAEQAGMESYAAAPKQDEIVQATFCGT